MPRGFTDSIQKAKEAFEELKTESLIKGKNKATYAQIAQKSATSRNNFYTKKNKLWEELVAEIDNFAKEFKNLAKGKYKNPEVETYKQEAKDWKEKYNAMAGQNYELLKKINDLERIIEDKQQSIDLLNKRFNKKY